MRISVFDIEADGLLDDATKIHCLSVWENGKKIKSTSNYDNMRSFFQKAECLVGHNIARYDVPLAEKILGIEIKPKKIVDTLPLSWYIYDKSRISHSLESYGEDYGLPKVEIDDWDNLSTEEYIERCERDVEINLRVWEDQLKFLRKLYGDDEGVWRAIDYISFKIRCARLQEAIRWKLDKPRCVKGRDELLALKDKKTEELKAVMPPVKKYKTIQKYKKLYKQNGELSADGQRWFNYLQEYGLPEDATEVRVVDKIEEPKPTSWPQIKELLFSKGWKPDEFKYDKEKDTGKLRKIPQINTQVPGKWGLTESVKRVVEKHPELEPLDGLSVITHRLSILEGFLEAERDGYVRAEIQGLTNTLRFKHSVCLNLPGVHAPYGELIRGCLIAPKGYELCGSDKSSLEDKVKQHFLYPHDPEYVEEMQTPGYDPHTSLAVFAGVITQEQEDQWKLEKDEKAPPSEVLPLVSGIRKPYKNTNYACQYGASGFKIGLTCGIPTEEGEKLHAAYWKKNWAINAVVEEQIVKKCGHTLWLWNPVSKLWYSLRHKKDIFSTLCQGTGVYCFDTWVKHVLSMREQLTAQFHDEIVLTIKKGFREQCENLLRKAVKMTNDELQLNVKLDVDVQFGANYAAIH